LSFFFKTRFTNSHKNSKLKPLTTRSITKADEELNSSQEMKNTPLYVPNTTKFPYV
jgi:hypothetical protein